MWGQGDKMYLKYKLKDSLFLRSGNLGDLLAQKHFWKTECLKMTGSVLWISVMPIDPVLLTLEKCPEHSINKTPWVKMTLFMFM